MKFPIFTFRPRSDSLRWLLAACLLAAGSVGCQRNGVSALSSDALNDDDVRLILNQAEAAANAEPSLVRVDEQGQPQPTRVHIIVMNQNARVVGRRSMPGAWHGSLSIATSKAYTAMAFSSDQNALTSRSIGALSQPGGPLWNIGNSNTGLFMPGLIEFAGGLPLYKGGRLVGGIGVSGDGIDQDERIALAGARGYEAPDVIRIDRVSNNTVPYVAEPDSQRDREE